MLLVTQELLVRLHKYKFLLSTQVCCLTKSQHFVQVVNLFIVVCFNITLSQLSIFYVTVVCLWLLFVLILSFVPSLYLYVSAIVVILLTYDGGYSNFTNLVFHRLITNGHGHYYYYYYSFVCNILDIISSRPELNKNKYTLIFFTNKIFPQIFYLRYYINSGLSPGCVLSFLFTESYFTSNNFIR